MGIMCPARGVPKKTPLNGTVGVRALAVPFVFKDKVIRKVWQVMRSDEVVNCPVHRADFTNNRRNTRGIKVYSPKTIMISSPPVFPVITLPTYDTESPRRTSYSMLPPCIERVRNLPNTISLKLTQPCTGMGHGPIVCAVWDPWPRRNMPR